MAPRAYPSGRGGHNPRVCVAHWRFVAHLSGYLAQPKTTPTFTSAAETRASPYERR